MFKKIILIIFAIFVLFILIIGVYFYICVNKPMSSSSELKSFEIVEGEGSIEIGKKLAQKGLTHCPSVFAIYVSYKNISLLPGIYYLSENMTMDEIIEPISQGKIEEYKITTIEGWRVAQIGEYLEKKNITTNDEFLKVAKDKEGYLFPDTYRIAKEATSEEIINLMLDNFHNRTEDFDVKPETVILASIVEREAKTDEDRTKIAGVYQNRLDIDMKLQADPTVQYAKGNWDPPTRADYENVESPYNTYLHKGLPPGPICNPGLASINAALSPEKHDYYYFFHLADGTTVFSKTKEEHEENLVKYKDKR